MTKCTLSLVILDWMWLDSFLLPRAAPGSLCLSTPARSNFLSELHSPLTQLSTPIPHLFFSQTASQTRFCEYKPDYTTLLMETLQAHPAFTVQASSHLPWPTAAVTLPRVPSLTAKLGFSLTVIRVSAQVLLTSDQPYFLSSSTILYHLFFKALVCLFTLDEKHESCPRYTLEA